MTARKDTSVVPDDNSILPEGVTWAEVVKLLNEKQYKQLFSVIDPKILKFATREKNKAKAIKALVRALQLTDPENATPEYAQKIVTVMQKIAQTALKQRKAKGRSPNTT